MAEYVTLNAEIRTVRGKKVKTLRQAGLTPFVVYGANTEPVALQTETKELVRVLAAAGGTQLVAIHVEGESQPRIVLARAVQRHVTRLTPTHADFLQVDVTRKISSEVPILIEGDPRMVDAGRAVLITPLNTITVEALPTDLPPAVVLQGDRFEAFDDAVHVRDLDLGPRVRILNDPDDLVARLVPSRLDAAEEAELEEAAAVEALEPVAAEAEPLDEDEGPAAEDE